MGKKISAEAASEILDQAPTAIIVVDGHWLCSYANASAEVFTGVNRAEITGRSLWDTFPALEASSFETQVRRASDDRKRIPFEFHYAPSARWFDVEAVRVL